MDTQLQNHSLRVERKHFTFDLRENPRGKFLRIVEEVNGRYDAAQEPFERGSYLRLQVNGTGEAHPLQRRKKAYLLLRKEHVSFCPLEPRLQIRQSVTTLVHASDMIQL